MKVHQTFRIDEDLLKKAKKQADKEHRKLCNLYELAVLEYLSKKK